MPDPRDFPGLGAPTPDPLHAVPDAPQEPPTGLSAQRLEDVAAYTAIPLLQLSVRDRRILAAALDFQITFGTTLGHNVDRHRVLLERLLEGDTGYGTPLCDLEVPEMPPADRDLSRAQELARDAMQAKYGQCVIRWQADRSVVITGLTDDIERERVCVERNGRERWRDQ